MPAPIRPVQPGDAISAAKFNEVVDALNALNRISGAFPICVSHDAAGVRIELARQFKAWLFQIETTPDEIPRTTDGIAYYAATRLRLDNDDEYASEQPQHVRLYDPLARVSPERVLRTGDWALAAFDADTGRWEIVGSGAASARIVRFRTTTTLAAGGSAAAVIVRQVGGVDTDGDAITVIDWSAPGTWYGPTGSQGIACKLSDRDAFDILWIEHPSLFAVAVATGPMAAGVLPVTVTAGFDGTGVLAGVDSFYDVAGNYASATAGETFIARLDPATSTYKIIDGPPGGASLIRFELYADLPEGGDADAHVVVWDAVGMNWPVDLAQLIDVWDPENIGPGLSGHRGWCTYRADSGRYEVVSLDEPPAEIGWFVATANHTLDATDMSILHYVEGQVCDDSTGDNPHGPSDLKFYLHCPTDACCPNVKYGAILPYHTDKNGRLVADGAYLDDYRGASKQHIGPVATIPFGWHLCDGDAGTPDLRSRFLLMAYGDDPSDADWDENGHGDEIGAAGGNKGHNHVDANNLDETPVAGQLHHYREGDADLETNDTELNIDASPGQQLTVDASGTYSGTATLSGFTGYSKTNIAVYDPITRKTIHQDHDHSFALEAEACGSGAYNVYLVESGGAADLFTSQAFQNKTYADCTSPAPLSCSDDRYKPAMLDHAVEEPGMTDLCGGAIWNPGSDSNIAGGGVYGHRHTLDGSTTVAGDIEIDASIAAKTIADALWIVDVTHYDGDASKYNLHKHGLIIDDHQLLPATHIPPYYALAQIMRVN